MDDGSLADLYRAVSADLFFYLFYTYIEQMRSVDRGGSAIFRAPPSLSLVVMTLAAAFALRRACLLIGGADFDCSPLGIRDILSAQHHNDRHFSQ